MVSIFKPILNQEKSSLILFNNDDSLKIKRAGRNLPWLSCLSFNRMDAHTLYYSKNIAITEEAALELNKFFK
jgi:large subunit ribosomal protein L4